MIEFSREAYDAIVDHALAGGDEEVCGILAGDRGAEDGSADSPENRAVVGGVHRVPNVADAPRTRYEVDPERQLAVFESVEREGREVVGFYHSHPRGGTVPSETDVAAAAWDGYSYVICALDGHPYVGSWRWNGERERFEQEVVRVA